VNYLPCVLDGAAGNELALTLEDGQALTIPRPSHVPEGGRALLAVRPEDIRLVAGEDRALRGRVVLRSFLGSLIEYQVRVGEAELRVHTSKHYVAAEDEEIGLVIQEGLLLDPDARTRPEARAS
jgi:ABC-type Fe3+/spermidine/putrescine transport system ATPase subunit